MMITDERAAYLISELTAPNGLTEEEAGSFVRFLRSLKFTPYPSITALLQLVGKDRPFREIVLRLGGVFVFAGTDDETVNAVAASIERVWLRTRSRGDHS
jgi:hypothetical protein